MQKEGDDFFFFQIAYFMGGTAFFLWFQPYFDYTITDKLTRVIKISNLMLFYLLTSVIFST